MNGQGKWRWIAPAALVVALVLCGSALGAPVGQISEFSTPTAGSGPEGIVAGPDGNLWAAEFAANRVSEINPTTGAITEFTAPTAGGGPVGVALGPDGNIWFTEQQHIARLRPDGTITEYKIPLPDGLRTNSANGIGSLGGKILVKSLPWPLGPGSIDLSAIKALTLVRI